MFHIEARQARSLKQGRVGCVALENRKQIVDGEASGVGMDSAEASSHVPASWIDELSHAIGVEKLTSKAGSETIFAIDVDDRANTGADDVDDAGGGFVGVHRNEDLGAPLRARFAS
jgi:hypothetical protein